MIINDIFIIQQHPTIIFIITRLLKPQQACIFIIDCRVPYFIDYAPDEVNSDLFRRPNHGTSILYIIGERCSVGSDRE